MHRDKQSDEKKLLRKLEEARKSVDAIRRGHLYPEVDPNKMKGAIPKSALRYVRRDLQNATWELRLPTRFKTVLRLSNILQMITLPYFGILIGTSLLRMTVPFTMEYHSLTLRRFADVCFGGPLHRSEAIHRKRPEQICRRALARAKS